jgi:hypothetical protein
VSESSQPSLSRAAGSGDAKMAVTRFSAGNYVTVPHRDRPFDRCLGFVCPDDMVVLVSEENRQPQRSGFEIPVLLLGNLHL